MFDDRVQAENVDVNRGTGSEGTCGMANFLHHDGRFRDPEAAAAILNRHCYPKPSAIGDRFAELMGKLVFAVFGSPITVVETVTKRSDRIPNRLPLCCIGQCFELLQQELPADPGLRSKRGMRIDTKQIIAQ